MPMIRVNLRKYNASTSTITAALTGTLAAGTAAVLYTSKTDNSAKAAVPRRQTIRRPPYVGIIETDFMDKIASKPYVQYHNSNSTNATLFSFPIRATNGLWSKTTASREDVNLISASNLSDSSSNKIEDQENRNVERPRGVPRRLRILAIDVPEFRDVFSGGECRVVLSRVFPDGVAPSKRLNRKHKLSLLSSHKSSESTNSTKSSTNKDEDSNNVDNVSAKNKNNGNTHESKSSQAATTTIEVAQKSLARSLFRCRRNATSSRIGVEVLEASVYDLNPYNMRRTYQLKFAGTSGNNTGAGDYRFDPGRYAYRANGNKTKSRQDNKGNVGNDDMLARRESSGHRTDSNYTDKVKGRKVVLTDKEPADEEGEDEDVEDFGFADVEDHEEYIDELMSENDDNDNSSTGKNNNVGKKTGYATEEDEIDAPWNQYAWIEEMQLRIHGLVPFGANIEQSSPFSRYVFGNVYRRTVSSSRGYFYWLVPSIFTSRGKTDEDGIDGDYGRNKRTINRSSSKPHAVIADGAALQRVPGSLRFLTKCCREADIPLFIINDPRVWGGNTHNDLESAAKDIRKTVKAQVVTKVLTIKEGSLFERGHMLGKLETDAKWQASEAARKTRQTLQDVRSRLRMGREKDWSKLTSDELLQRLIDHKVITVHHNVKNGNRNNDATEEYYSEALLNVCRKCIEKEEMKHRSSSAVKATDDTTNVDSSTNDDQEATLTEKEQIQ